MKRPITFTVYRDKRGEHRWRAKHANGRIIADSAEGYATRGGALRAADAFVKAITLGPTPEVLTTETH